MAQTRRAGRSARGAPRGARGRSKGVEEDDNDINSVHKEMLNDLERTNSDSDTNYQTPNKKRRLMRPGERLDNQQEHATISAPQDGLPSDPSSGDGVSAEKQTALLGSSSDESDAAWEEVEIGLRPATGEDQEIKTEALKEAAAQDDGMNLILGDSKGPGSSSRTPRKGISLVDKQRRLEIHRMHVLCLLAHLDTRNDWCNDSQVQASVRKSLSARTLSYLNPEGSDSQFQRSRSFMEGLEQASAAWRATFKKTCRGSSRSVWTDDSQESRTPAIPKMLDKSTDIVGFRQLANRPETSRDIGAQLFCSLLRSAGVMTRLVCSLQPLSFIMAGPRPTVRQDLISESTGGENRPNDYNDEEIEETEAHASPLKMPKPISESSKSRRRIGQPSFREVPGKSTSRQPKKRVSRKPIRESKFPVYWVEAFNRALQKWIPVDPLAPDTINKPHKFEPPLGDSDIGLSYVLAFEEDGVAKDVTRRYTKAFNAKTRKLRVESSSGGSRWWSKVLRAFSRGWELDRDQIENSELASKEAQEPMPRNVQDFKDHPIYALERHLKRNEVVHPRHEAGKVGAGKSLTASGARTLEPVFRRQNVCHVRSADAWFRQGREIKASEQPLKRSAPKRTIRALHREEAEKDGEEDEIRVGLYAEFQTAIYRAPRILNGRVPKNAYGNLDVYTPSMVPEGGVHVKHPEAIYAARLLGIDFAEAVSGFDFKGRRGTAVISGIVIPLECEEAVRAVIACIRERKEDEVTARKTYEALKAWKHFLVALRVRERIAGYAVDGETQNSEAQPEAESETELTPEFEGGGFIPDDEHEPTKPTVGKFKDLTSMAGGFIPNDEDDSTQYTAAKFESFADEGGGFLPDDVHGPSQPSAGKSQSECSTGLDDFQPSKKGKKPQCGDSEQNDAGCQHVATQSPPAVSSQTAHASANDASTEAVKDEESNQVGSHADGFDLNVPEFDYDGTPISLGRDDDLEMQQAILQSAQAAPRLDGASNTSSPTLGDTGGADATTSGSVWESQDEIPAQSKADAQNGRSVDGPAVTVAESSERDDTQRKERSSDEGSLLSHDPDDDDAEPDWLT